MGTNSGNTSSDGILSDHQLVQRAVEQGDQSAYAELMHRYRDAVYFRFLKKTNSPVEADDLTIETFGKAFLNLRQFSNDYTFSTWLFSIASNHYIDFMRRKKDAMLLIDDRSAGATDYRNNHLRNEVPGPEEELIEREKLEHLRKVVEKLKPHYRELIELRYYQELSINEVATAMNLPEGTVKAQLFRAREFLHNVWKSSGEKP
jgi:RNA polymerase sigma-70 factor (ECF subfamily)